MIGVFDSGIGGLTVLRELLHDLPEFGYAYLGDTARTPYGSKSSETVRRYAREDAQFLVECGARLIVIACNTASAVAADDLRAAFPSVPIVEVVTPAVELAVAATRSGRIGVIGTRATILSGVYEREIAKRLPTATVRGIAAPLLVPLVEEGWCDAPETVSIVRSYLQPIREAGIDTLILGCTHYPFLEPLIVEEAGEETVIVNPARAIAARVRELLDGDAALAAACRGGARLFALTDRTTHFERLAAAWLGLGKQITINLVELGAMVMVR